MEKSFEDIKKVVPRLGGYHYEFQVGALRLLDLIEGKADKVEFESARDSSDFFDDIKVFHKDQIHHYQVKWGLKRKPIGFRDLINSSSNLYFPNLFDTWKFYSKKSPKQKHVFHIYSSKNTDQNDELFSYFISPKEEEKQFSDNKSGTFKLNPEILKTEKFSHIKTILEENSDTDVASFFDSLILEINQPNMPSDEESEKQFGNPIRNVLLEKISYRLGLDKFPSLLRPIDVLALLVEESYLSAIHQRVITREFLAQKIGIKLNLETIAQIFPFDKEHYVETHLPVEKLNSIFKESSGELIGVIGLPGSGKSHLLTFWKRWLEKFDIKPIMYYCFVGHEHHPDVRITQNQLLQNLITNILILYPKLGSLEEHSLLAATPERLQNLMIKLGEHAKAQNQIIPIIIDGLDHVVRTKEKYSQFSSTKTDLLGFFDFLDIPKGITFVIGSQPGSHLNEIQKRFGNDQFIEIDGFTLNESKNFLEKFGITTASISENIINLVIEKTAGSPLLLAYFVQANQNLSLDERLSHIKNNYQTMPNTDGNVKKYYDWLWTGISSNHLTNHYARLLAVLDFPASANLLENTISKSIRLGNSVDECMKPLIPLIRNTVDGVSFFHDSFATYVFSNNDFSIDDKYWYFENLYQYFSGIGLHSNDLAYVKGLEFAFKAKLYQTITDLITVDFIDQSLLNGFSIERILTQIDFAIQSSIHLKNIPLLVKNCFLRKYTQDRLEYYYSPNEIAKFFIKLKKHEQLKRLILTNNSLNTDLVSTIDLLSLCLENEIKLPYDKIMSLWYSKIKQETEEIKEELNAVNKKNYAKVISHVYGLQYTLNWIEKNNDLKFKENVFQSIGRFSSSTDIKKLIQKSEYAYGDLIIILSSLIKLGDKIQAKKLLSNALTKRDFVTPYLINLGMFLGVDGKIFEKYCKIFVPSKPGNHPWDEEILEFHKFEESVKSLTYCGKNDELENVISTIKTYPLTTPRLLQEMTFLVSKIEGKIRSNHADSLESDNLLVELERFINHTTLPGISPRDFDCTRLGSVAKHILTKLVRCYLRIANKPDLEKLVELVLKLNNKFEWHSPGIEWILVSTEHMIACFSEVMRKYPDNAEIKQKIISALISTEIPASTGYRVDYFLKISDVYLKYDMKKEAENAFVNAIKSSHAYGYRKDLFLDEIHDVVINLNMLNTSKALIHAADILDLSKYLWGVTDHAENKFISGNVVQELLRLKTSAGIKLLQQFSNEDFDLPFIECASYVIAEMDNSPLSLRWNFVKNLSYDSGAGYNDKNWLMNMKFELVKQSIAKKQHKLAKEIMENIKEQIEIEFDSYERRWEVDFQKYASSLEIDPLSLVTKSSSDSYLVDLDRNPKNVLKDGTIDEIIEQYHQLDKKQTFDAGKDLEIILENKIKTLEEKDLDKLTGFLFQRLFHDSTCGNLLKKIALCYQGKNDKKFIQTVFLAFSTYGWIGYGYPSIVNWLTETYKHDSQKTMDYVLEEFAKFSVDRYGPHGAVKRLAEFLYLTGQIEILEELYDVLHDFCKTFFRTYTENFDKFRWLRGSTLEQISDEEIINEFINIEQH